MQKHGYATRKNRPAEYVAWDSMIRRCVNERHPCFKNYGARGIEVCQEWVDSFEAFLRDVGSRPSPEYSLGRIDNQLGYKPGNVQWETIDQQSNNKRTNHLLSHNGKTQTIALWESELGLAKGVLRTRIWRGWPVDRALTTASMKART